MDEEIGEVQRDDGSGRFSLDIEGAVAELVFERSGGRLVLTHTEVPPPLSGRGIGGHLVEAAMSFAVDEGLTVVPRCPFVRDWLDRHAAVAEQLTIERPGAR